MRKLLLLCCVFPVLSGCVAAVLAGGATAGGAAIVYDKRSLKTMNQDHYNTARGQMLINKSKRLNSHSHISVATFNHIMLMVGQAQTPELRNYAYKLLSNNIKSIQRIYNQVTIAPSLTFLQRSDDAWITTKVKTAMLTAKGLRSSQIKVVTEAKTVYLLGLVGRQQSALATNIARRVSGVKKVVKVFQYT